MPDSITYLAGKALCKMLGEMVPTRDEIRGLSRGLLVSRSGKPAPCPTRFSEWLDEHSDLKVERIGLEYRLKKARQRLEEVPIPPRPKSVHANFQGEPVVNSVGINANFAGKATTAFAESTAITTAGAAGQLHDTGAIPHRGLGRQLISGVTRGSFGFEIELPPPTEGERDSGQTDNPAEKAVEMIQDLLETSLTGTDEELAKLTDRMHTQGQSGKWPSS